MITNTKNKRKNQNSNNDDKKTLLQQIKKNMK